ncbi:MAG: glutamate synthase subunit alpha, partial [Candidatus Dadabacteria bacterium]|nr:glutamate synthase subunit alpha [Candidatus Dadabacteria bacterium]NIQ16997.1 glutamate synthase subunit alpha [Candidatus Dadabacteria bacterium]
MKFKGLPPKHGLYDPIFEHDACGIGFVVNIKGKKSNSIINQALTILKNLEHRGACGCEVNTGDGAGILFQIPHDFFVKKSSEIGFELPEIDKYGVGMIFMSPDKEGESKTKAIFEKIVKEEGQELLGWRDVPTDNSSLGDTSKGCEPAVRQVFIKRSSNIDNNLDFERVLYVIRKRAENEIRLTDYDWGEHFYVMSLSSKTIVYKGMLTTWQVELYYPDLNDQLMSSSIALVHSRFSTNTFPSWDRSHPYRYIIHNGEINTLRGNTNWMHARQAVLASPLYDDISKIFPIISPHGSDSAGFDNALEFLTLSGYSIDHAVMMMIPEPWSKHKSMDQERMDFYQFHSCLMEPWDGPASIAFTDGEKVGAVLDRNGLRPTRYYVTKDDLVILGSEVGVLEVPAEKVKYKGRLQPGRMLLIDTNEGRIVGDEELKNRLSKQHPYGEWLSENLLHIDNIEESERSTKAEYNQEELLVKQRVYGYTFEDLRVLIGPMATNAVEPIGAMGVDTPLAALSDKSKLLYNYFKQLFAQVTNPAIDAIREEIITGTKVTLGPQLNILSPSPKSCHKIELDTPFLTNGELNKLKELNNSDFKSSVVPIHFDPTGNGEALEKALEDMFTTVDKEIEDGANIIILSDRGFDK